MRKTITSTRLSETLTLSECTDGFWLFDKTQGSNLSMRAATPTGALVEAVTYYQRQLFLAVSYYQRQLFLAESEISALNERFEVPRILKG